MKFNTCAYKLNIKKSTESDGAEIKFKSQAAKILPERNSVSTAGIINILNR